MGVGLFTELVRGLIGLIEPILILHEPLHRAPWPTLDKSNNLNEGLEGELIVLKNELRKSEVG